MNSHYEESLIGNEEKDNTYNRKYYTKRNYFKRNQKSRSGGRLPFTTKQRDVLNNYIIAHPTCRPTAEEKKQYSYTLIFFNNFFFYFFVS